MNTQAQSVRLGGDAQLLLVASTRCSEVVDSGRFATTTPWMLASMLWRRFSFQMLLTLA